MNVVEEYLEKNSTKKLSISTLKQRLNITLKKVVFLIHESSHIRQVYPLEVGSLKNQLSVYTYM
jgi:hypothetical protein